MAYSISGNLRRMSKEQGTRVFKQIVIFFSGQHRHSLIDSSVSRLLFVDISLTAVHQSKALLKTVLLDNLGYPSIPLCLFAASLILCVPSSIDFIKPRFNT